MWCAAFACLCSAHLKHRILLLKPGCKARGKLVVSAAQDGHQPEAQLGCGGTGRKWAGKRVMHRQPQARYALGHSTAS